MTNPSPAFQRASILQQQGRHTDAIRELHQYISQQPRDAIAHAMLAQSLCELERFDEAEREAQEAVGLSPDEGFTHAAYAAVLHGRNKLSTAENAIRQALAIEPFESAYFGRLAAILIGQRRWRDALNAADEGLAFDPTDSVCLNIRALALTQLGDRAAAARTTEGALAEDPENAFTHANRGWTLLHESKPKEAMTHFREALRLDPQMDFARAGIVEALKAQNFFYRAMLKYFLFMSRLGSGAQWAIMIGGYVGYRALSNAADTNPNLEQWVWPILWAYIAFAISTWLSSTLFNLMLRFHPFGKHVLSRDERLTSNFVATAMGLAIVSGLTGWWLDQVWLITLAIVSAGLSLPLSLLLSCDKGWPRWAMSAILGAVGLVGTGAVLLTYNDGGEKGSSALFTLFLYGCILSQFAGVGLAQARATR